MEVENKVTTLEMKPRPSRGKLTFYLLKLTVPPYILHSNREQDNVIDSKDFPFLVVIYFAKSRAFPGKL